jgi:hypothetical protein
MIPVHGQDLLAGLITVAALAYLVRRRLRSRGAACEGCERGGCATESRPAGSAAEGPGALLSIEGLSPGDRKQDQD